MQYRLIYIGLGLIAVAAIIAGFVLSPDGESIVLPGPVESVSPAPGAQVPLQTIVEIDLEVGYVAEIWVDGWPVTNASFVEATGVYRWDPTSHDPGFGEWSAGEHTVRIVWNTYSGLPDTGTFEWTFRTS